MKEIIKYKIDILGLCETRWACSKSVKEDKATGVCSRHLIKYYINIKYHILGIGTCYKSSDWLETSQRTNNYSTFLGKTCLNHHNSRMETDDNNVGN